MLEGLPLADIGAGALLTFVVLLVLTDKLVWHKRLDVIVRQLEASQKQNVELVKQNTLLLESAIPTVNTVLTALYERAEE